jgi:polyisoprenoid-binding protein YceI
VSRAEAAVSESAATASGAVDQTPATYVVESTSLQVSFTMAGVQQLLWSIELGYNTGQIYDSYAAVSVDAMTGVATVVGFG